MTMLMYPTFSPAESWASITIGLEAITVVTGMKSLPLATKETAADSGTAEERLQGAGQISCEICRTARPELGGMVVGVLARRGVGGRAGCGGSAIAVAGGIRRAGQGVPRGVLRTRRSRLVRPSPNTTDPGDPMRPDHHDSREHHPHRHHRTQHLHDPLHPPHPRAPRNPTRGKPPDVRLQPARGLTHGMGQIVAHATPFWLGLSLRDVRRTTPRACYAVGTGTAAASSGNGRGCRSRPLA